MKKLYALIAALFITGQAIAQPLATGIPPGAGASGVSTFSGDGALISNSASTGAVTATLGNAAANTVWGNNTSGSAAPGYQTSIAISGTAATAAHTITSSSANSLSVGRQGVTSPAFNVDASAATSVTGVGITSAASGGGVTLSAISSATNEQITIQGKGSGNIRINSGGGGQVAIGAFGGDTHLFNAFSAQIGPLGGYSAGASSHFSVISTQADNGLTAATEANGVYFNLGNTSTHNTGTIATQRDVRITPKTHAFVAASVVTNAAALGVDAPPSGGTNATLTNSSAIYVPSATIANTTNGYGLNVSAPSGASTLNQAALFTGDVGITSGNIISNTAGKGIQIKSGSNARIGTGTLSGGTLAVANTSVTANTLVFLTDTTNGSLANVGSLTAVTSAGVGFTVNSTNVLDTSTFNWLLIEKN